MDRFETKSYKKLAAKIEQIEKDNSNNLENLAGLCDRICSESDEDEEEIMEAAESIRTKISDMIKKVEVESET